MSAIDGVVVFIVFATTFVFLDRHSWIFGEKTGVLNLIVSCSALGLAMYGLRRPKPEPEDRRRIILDLIHEWNSLLMIRARIVVIKYIKKGKVHAFHSLDAAVGQVGDCEAEAVFKVLFFLEKCVNLGVLDDETFRSTCFHYVAWYYDYLIVPSIRSKEVLGPGYGLLGLLYGNLKERRKDFDDPYTNPIHSKTIQGDFLALPRRARVENPLLTASD